MTNATPDSVTLHLGDCSYVLKTLPETSVNLIVTSPPYNVNLGYNSHNDDMPYSDYLAFMKDVFTAMHRVLAPDGRVAINIGDGKNGRVPTHSDFIQMLIGLGMIPISTIIWWKHTTSNRAAWGSFMSPSSPSFPSQMEYILLFGKTEKLQHTGTPTVSKEDFIAWTNPIWEFQPESRIQEYGHPAMFPVELPRRCIEMLTYKEDVVCDPFMGSGTTGVACVKTERRFIGIEKDETYFAMASERVNREKSKPLQDFLQFPIDR